MPSDSNGFNDESSVLVVGAGPTGLTLACQLIRFGVRFRIIDKQVARTRESRALAVQARSLEVLQALGIGELLAQRGSTTTRLKLHVDRDEPPEIDLGAVARTDTRFPYILFVSQPNTEAVLVEYLESRGVRIERGVELTGYQAEAESIRCELLCRDGRTEKALARYLMGCDGAHSTVRKGTSIPFEGGAYPQTFALGDVEADGLLESSAIHAFGMGRGFAMFFPLGLRPPGELWRWRRTALRTKHRVVRMTMSRHTTCHSRSSKQWSTIPPLVRCACETQPG